MNYVEVYAETTVLQSEIAATIQQLLNCSTEDLLEELNVSAAQKLSELRTKIRTLTHLNDADSNDENIQQRRHNCQQVESAMQRLKDDLRKRVCLVEQQLAAGNRASLLGEDTNQPRSKVTGAEASTRLRAVNNMVGQIIHRGQVLLHNLVNRSLPFYGFRQRRKS